MEPVPAPSLETVGNRGLSLPSADGVGEAEEQCESVVETEEDFDKDGEVVRVGELEETGEVV